MFSTSRLTRREPATARTKCRVIVMVALLAATAMPAAAQQSSPTASAPSFQVYPCPAEKLDATVSRLRTEFQTVPEVRIAADARANQILVYAPPEMHPQIAQRMAALFPGADANQSRPAAANPPGSAAESRVAKSSTVALRNTTSRQFEEAIVAALGKRLAALPAMELGVKSYQLALPGGGTVRLDVQQQTNRAALQGPAAAVDSCIRLIQALDAGETAADRSTRLVPLQRGVTPSVRRAVDAIQTSGGSRPTQRGPLVTMLFQQPGEAEQQALPPGAAPAQPPAVAPEAEEPGKKEGGGLIGSVQVEIMPELDILIIRGHKRDVEQVQEIIKQIEELSEQTKPAIEIYQLQHVDAGAMADVVGPLYEDVFALRQGYVSITPLMKPNALLLIGRTESVQMVIELVKRLDQPVPPETQFRVFRLQHAPALMVQTTILDFYTGRGGLGPRIRATADFRSNAIIVQAGLRDLEEIAELISRIDTPSSAAVNELRVFELENSLSDDLAPVLQGAITGQQVTRPGVGAAGFPGAFGAAGAIPGAAGFPGAAGGAAAMAQQKSTALQFITIDSKGRRLVNSGILTDVRIMSDPRSNTLLVSAPTQSMELIEALIRQLDRLPSVEAKIKVFTIQNGDATSLATMLQDLFMRQVAPGQMGMPPTITRGESLLVPLRLTVDMRTNSIIAIGSVGDLEVAEAILLRLDDSDIRHRKTVVYRLNNAPADQVSNAITMFLSSERAVVMMGMASAFEQIQREVVVVPEMVTNSLIVSATPRFFEEISKIIEQLDERPPMVVIQVLIAELELNNHNEFGIELGLQDGILFDRSVLSSVITTPFNMATYTPGVNFNGQPLGQASVIGNQSTVGTQGTTNFSVGRANNEVGFGGLLLSASSENVSVIIRALSECHKLQVLSRPQVMTLNNQPAYIQVGQRVPRVTNVTFSTFGQTNTTTLDNVGLQLYVIPRISPDGMVVMAIDAEKSEVGPEIEGIPISISNTGQVVRSPRYDTTVAQTVVSAASGQTVILGGLISNQKSEFHRKVPWLGDLPVIGRAFRFDGTVSRRKELLMIMTPHIVRNEGDMEKIRQVEASRLHWCLADVIAIHGGSEFRSRTDEWSDAETAVIYPDTNPGAQLNPPGGGTPTAPEPVPAPSGAPDTRDPKQGPALTPPAPSAARSRVEEPPAEPTSRASGLGNTPGLAKPSSTPLQGQQTNQAAAQWPAYPAAAQAAIYQPRYQPAVSPSAPGFGAAGQVVPSSYDTQQQPGLPYPSPGGAQPTQYLQPPMSPTPPPQTPPIR